jgi:hypothetical protein
MLHNGLLNLSGIPMNRFSKYSLGLVLAFVLSSACLAAKPEIEADKALKSNSHGWSVYVDVNFGMRKHMAVSDINEMHVAMSKAGFEPVSLVTHTENGDLLGYVITYRKR